MRYSGDEGDYIDPVGPQAVDELLVSIRHTVHEGRDINFSDLWGFELSRTSRSHPLQPGPGISSKHQHLHLTWVMRTSTDGEVVWFRSIDSR